MAVVLKNFDRSRWIALRYNSQHRVTADAMPSAAPIKGATVSPDALTAVHRNKVVSNPSRPTAANAVSASAPAPTARATPTWPRSSEESDLAARRIQKTMPVTSATAVTLRMPPIASWTLVDSTLVENVSTAAKLPATATAPATPIQIGAADGVLPSSVVERWTAASRIETTMPASSPSRSPMRKLGMASAQVTLKS